MNEKRWTDMSLAELDAFMNAHPTYFMTPKQASDWWAGVERLIRRDLEGKRTGRTYERVCIGTNSKEMPVYEQRET